mmetsp:Transcript_41689/g.90864  ORF Transcript_41689/g.90864 Transcript_41689/m.90864 type:complete len:265 (-) Transcript_41689:385-1179(-)
MWRWSCHTGGAPTSRPRMLRGLSAPAAKLPRRGLRSNSSVPGSFILPGASRLQVSPSGARRMRHSLAAAPTGPRGGPFLDRHRNDGLGLSAPTSRRSWAFRARPADRARHCGPDLLPQGRREHISQLQNTTDAVKAKPIGEALDGSADMSSSFMLRPDAGRAGPGPRPSSDAFVGEPGVRGRSIRWLSIRWHYVEVVVVATRSSRVLARHRRLAKRPARHGASRRGHPGTAFSAGLSSERDRRQVPSDLPILVLRDGLGRTGSW